MTQWNVSRGPPLAEGADFDGAMDPLPWPDTLTASSWYALAWSNAVDQALPSRPRLQRDAQGVPLRRELRLDRKYVPANDLTCLFGSNIFVSERFARALVESGASGFTLEAAPHVSPHPVSGHLLFRLEAQGWLGPLVEPRPEGAAAGAPRAAEAGQLVLQVPRHPMSFDATAWNGLDVCLSPWFGPRRADWRCLLLPGHVLAAVVERLPDLGCGAVPVQLAGKLPPRATGIPPVHIDPGPRPQPVPLDTSMAAIRARHPPHHLLAAGATEAELRDAAAQAPFALPEAYLRLLREWNGLMLYRTDWNPSAAALSLWPTSQRAKRTLNWLKYSNAAQMTLGQRVRTGEWFGFGEDVQGNVLWCLDAAGLVRGFGKEGIIYGPDTPFEVWFGDMVRDLDWASDHPDAPGASELLARSGRM